MTTMTDINDVRQAVRYAEDMDRLPDVSCIIIRIGRKMKVLNLDACDDAGITKTYLEYSARYGDENVRVCRVMSAKVSRAVEFG